MLNSRPLCVGALSTAPLFCMGLALSFALTSCDSNAPKFSEAGIQLGAAPGADARGVSSTENRTDTSQEGDGPDDLTPDDKGETSQDGIALVKWSFSASSLVKGQLSYASTSKETTQALVMDNNVAQSSQDFQQINRPVITEVFTQGSDLKDQNEVFNQNSRSSGALDLLLVIDNSGSMTEEQQNLATKLSPLLSFVQNSDWRIGVVTTDPKDGCLRGLINKTDVNGNELFSSAVQAGLKGSGNERGIQQAVSGLKGECNPSGSWLRPQSTVGVLIVSDEDNCSDGQGCGTDPWALGSHLTDYLSSIRQPGVNARVYGLIGHPSLTSAQCKTMAAKANIYASVIEQTGGTWGSICDADYSHTLESISRDISVILLSQFSLKHTPTPGTLNVFINGSLQASGYTLHENVIEFQTPPVAGATVSFAYKFNSIAPKADFALREAPDAAHLSVYLDGVKTTNYRFDPSSQALIFPLPPKADAIKAVYRRGEELIKDFHLVETEQSIQAVVSVDGTVLPESSYTLHRQSGVLSFAKAPLDGSKINVSFIKVLAHRLDYPLYLDPSQQPVAKDSGSGQTLAALSEGAVVRFKEEDYKPGRGVLLTARDSGDWIVPLSSRIAVVSAQVTSETSGVVCNTIQYRPGSIDLSACAYPAGTKVKVDFEWEEERRERFDLALSDGVPPSATWVVKVNGNETKDYILEADIGYLKILNLPPQAQIEVSMQVH